MSLILTSLNTMTKIYFAQVHHSRNSSLDKAYRIFHYYIHGIIFFTAVQWEKNGLCCQLMISRCNLEFVLYPFKVFSLSYSRQRGDNGITGYVWVASGRAEYQTNQSGRSLPLKASITLFSMPFKTTTSFIVASLLKVNRGNWKQTTPCKFL